MEKILISSDGSEHKLCPLDLTEFMMLKGSNVTVENASAFWKAFKQANNYVELAEVFTEGSKVVMRDGEADLTWNIKDNEWQVISKPKNYFPIDDCNTLQQMVAGDVILDFYYDHQFCMNEELYFQKGLFKNEMMSTPLANGPVVPRTMTGTICVEDIPVQTFVEMAAGVTLQKIGDPKAFVKSMGINPITGCLTMKWNSEVDPGLTHAVVSYEYDYANESGMVKGESGKWYKQFPPQQEQTTNVVIE